MEFHAVCSLVISLVTRLVDQLLRTKSFSLTALSLRVCAAQAMCYPSFPQTISLTPLPFRRGISLRLTPCKELRQVLPLPSETSLTPSTFQRVMLLQTCPTTSLLFDSFGSLSRRTWAAAFRRTLTPWLLAAITT